MVRGQVQQGAGYRHFRLQELLIEELTSLLRDDVGDPELSPVRITGVALSVDYRHARIHFATYATPGQPCPPSRVARIESALARVTPYLRAQIAISIDVKHVPQLRFLFDGVVLEDAEVESCLP